MCGILGYLGPRAFDINCFGGALDVMKNRGPDDRGIYEEPECLLGQRRLAILDLSAAGHQPMRSRDGRFVIVYNGEVYNFRELRRGLEAEGQQFSTKTDTEVILALYAKEGPACLDRFRGMFAIAIWDRLKRTLFLARDRMGIKPLYLWRRPGSLAFASEIRALRALPCGPAAIDPEAVVQFLAWGHVPAPVTITRGVECMMPATWHLWQDGKLETQTYWEFPCVDAAAGRNPHAYLYKTRDEAVEALRPILKEAVAFRCISDAPLGAFLSGGIDSSAVVSLMRAAGQEDVHTVSISFPGSTLDESAFAVTVARQFGTFHHNVPVSTSSAKEELGEFFAALDQPTCDGFNAFVVSKHARLAGLTVAMSGLGGDELFGGYRHHRWIVNTERWLRQISRSMTTSLAKGAANLGLCSRKLEEALALEGALLARLYYGARGLFTPSQIRTLVHPEVLKESDLGRTRSSCLLPSIPKTVLQQRGSQSVFHTVAALELRRYMHDQLLRDSDVFGLTHSLEIRVPLIDHKVVETVFNTAPTAILAGPIPRRPKALLLDALPSALPAACTSRRKMGFAFPFGEWLPQWCADLEAPTLEPVTARASEAVLRREALANVWRQFSNGRLHWSRPWALYVIGRATQEAPRF